MVKKKEGVKKKVVKKDNSKISRGAVFGLIGLFLVFSIASIFIWQDTSVQNQSVTGYANLNEIIVGGNLVGTELFFRWVFFGIITLLVFSALSVIEFPKNPFFKWLLAAPISFVSIAVINTTDFNTSVLTYGSLGLTLIAIIPLGVILLFSAKFLEGPKSVIKILFQLMLWYFYTAFSLYILATLIYKGVGRFTPWTGEFWIGVVSKVGWVVPAIYLGGLIMAIVIIWKNQKFRKWITEIGAELIIDRGTMADASRRATGVASGVVRPPSGRTSDDYDQFPW